jgi:DNA-binding response OmpR family regulator
MTDATAGSVLVIEDDKEIVDLVSLHLRDMGLEVERAGNGRDGLEKALAGEHVLIILDLMLPEIDGLEICRRVRHARGYTPILMLTAKSEELDTVVGLEVGADDYMTKPFSVRELVARVRAILRRASELAGPSPHEQTEEPLRIGDLAIDRRGRRVLVAGKEVPLTAKEFDLLLLFAEHPNQAFSRRQLLERVWGYHYEGYEHTVNSHINRLRGKIEQDPSRPRYIQTVWGFGYRFAPPEEEE